MDSNLDLSHWSLCVTGYEERNYGQDLPAVELERILAEELSQEFVTVSLGRSTGDGIDVFLYCDSAVVLYGDQAGRKWCSVDLEHVNEPNSGQLVRMSPHDSEDFSFPRWNVISRQVALRVLRSYIDNLQPNGLYAVGLDGTTLLPLK